MKQIVKLGFILALVLAVHDALGQAWQPQPKPTTVVSWQSKELQHNLGEVARQYKAAPRAHITVRWVLEDNGVIRKEWVIRRVDERPVFPGPETLYTFGKK